MPVKKGLATWAGLVAALGQYAAAVAVFLEADDQSVALGPLVTATVTLVTVIVGRMQQAKALAARPAPTFTTGSTSSSATGNVTWTGGAPAASFKGAIAAVDELTAATETNTAALEEQMGDPDALPDYKTETDPPPDTGDTSANGDNGEREA